MKVLVFGAGAIGSAFGGFLSPFHDVTLLGRRPHLEKIREEGLQVSGIWGRHTFKNLRCENRFQSLRQADPFFDLVLVTVKSFDTEKAAAQIAEILGPQTLVLSLQNGLGNIERLCRMLPPPQVLVGRVIFGVTQDEPGKIRVTVIAEPTAVGEIRRKKITPRIRRLARLFSEAGLPTVPCRDIQSLLWVKVIYNSALNPLASLLECHYGLLGEKDLTRWAMEEIVHEIYAVAEKTGVHLHPARAEKYLRLFYSKLLPRTYDHRPSMLQDLEKGRRTEMDSLNGAIVRLGRREGVKTPMNRWLQRRIQEKEALVCR